MPARTGVWIGKVPGAKSARRNGKNEKMTDLFSKFDPLIQQRENLLATGVRDPFSLVMDEVKSPTVAVCNGRETILLGTYNYMGMTFDPDVISFEQILDHFFAEHNPTGAKARAAH